MQQRGKRTARAFLAGAAAGVIIGSQAQPFHRHHLQVRRELAQRGEIHKPARTVFTAARTYKPVLKINKHNAAGVATGVAINSAKIGGLFALLSWLKNRKKKNRGA